MIRLLMAVPVVSWILFAVLWFRGVEFRIGFVLVVVCGPVFLVDTLDAMRGVPRELRDMMQLVPADDAAVLHQADAAGDPAEPSSPAGRSISAWRSASSPSPSWSAP